MTDAAYLNLIGQVMERGEEVQTRNATCRRIFAEKVNFTSTPLVTVRRTAWKNALREWEWFMSGSCKVDDLHPKVQPWWRPFQDEHGDVLNNYSEQFRYFQGALGGGYNWERVQVDQVEYLLEGVREHPYSRRNVITTWNTAEMVHPSTTITNCHGTIIQAFVDGANSLHLVMYQRSADVIVGLPHNWVQYWAFLLWLAHRGGRLPGSFTWLGGDIHIYPQHYGLAERLRAQSPRTSPALVYSPTAGDFRADDFTLDGPYVPALDERAEMIT